MFRKFINKFKPKKITEILPYQICNVSKLPIPMKNNFLYKVSEICAKESNEEKAWELSKKILNTKSINVNNLSEFYNAGSKILSNYSADVNFLPWIHFKPTQSKDVFFKIFDDDKYQYFQFKKVFDLVQSIIKYGYLPEKFKTRQGGISGYFLIKDNKKVFYVVSGNHRVAALSYLFPNKKIPVVFESLINPKKVEIEGTSFEKSRIHPEYFSFDDVASWPSVKSGFIDKNCAKVIFLTYFKRINFREKNLTHFVEKKVGNFQNFDKL